MNLFKNKLVFVILLLLFYFFLTAIQAVELELSPEKQVLQVGEKTTISISGFTGKITWSALKGQILSSSGNQAIYIAPEQPGTDAVTVMDSTGTVQAIQIVILPKDEGVFSAKNSSWEIFTGRNFVQAITLSDDGKTLWIGTQGGLEQRDAATEKLVKVLSTLDKLPSNNVTTLLTDGNNGLIIGTSNGLAYLDSQGESSVIDVNNSELLSNAIGAIENDGYGGLWIGGWFSGIAHLSQEGEWSMFHSFNSDLPNNTIYDLETDGKGGVWIGTEGGLAHYLPTDGIKNDWTIFKDTSGLPDNAVHAILKNTDDGLWVGTGKGLALLSNDGSWKIYNTDNSDLPANDIWSLAKDSQGGLWIGTNGGGLVHLDDNGKWTVFSTQHSNFPYDGVHTLFDDGHGKLWVGTGDGGFSHPNKNKNLVAFGDGGIGVIRIDSDNKWERLETTNSGISTNQITALVKDDSGLWIGTQMGGNQGGIDHLSESGEWTHYNINNSPLPDNDITALLSDDNGGIWIATYSYGVAHLDNQKQWTIYNTNNSKLPDNNVKTIVSDNRGGLWIGTGYFTGTLGGSGGLAHFDNQGNWTVYRKDNSPLPNNTVATLASDGKGGVWIGMTIEFASYEVKSEGGLVHLSYDGEWKIFDTDNSDLPHRFIYALAYDGNNGVWVDTEEGLAHLNSTEQWITFNRADSGLPDNSVGTFLSDNKGGLWIGTLNRGLAYLNKQGKWIVFNTLNSNLPVNYIGALVEDGKNGLWVGTQGGLAHLTFTSTEDVDTMTDAITEEILANQRAAIIIAGGGADSTNSLWYATDTTTNYIYKVFNARKFTNEDIYYLSPKSWADFNGDGFNDRIVDAPNSERPLTVEDVREALAWATKRGKLGQPLYIFFVDHGGTDKLQLAKLSYLKAEELRAVLDDYQAATGNSVILVIDACYSGSFLTKLATPNRAVISSTGNDKLAYFVEKQGFSYFLAEGLNKGMNFSEAFKVARNKQNQMLGKSTQITGNTTAIDAVANLQTPQVDDDGDGIFSDQDGQWLKQIYVNGNFGTGDFTLAVEALIPSAHLDVGSTITLKAKADTAVGQVRRVWAILRPPKINQVIDTNGTPILAFPNIELSFIGEGIWETTWNGAIYNGDYQLTFYAEDNQGNIASSEQDTVLTVTGGINPPMTAQVQIHLEKDRYQRGENFKATLTEDLGWGYDLYAAVLFPDGQNFMTLKNTNDLRPLNEAKPWYAARKQHQAVTLFDLTLPADLPTGQYCLFGILSPEQNDVFETLEKGLWVMDSKCFEVF